MLTLKCKLNLIREIVRYIQDNALVAIQIFAFKIDGNYSTENMKAMLIDNYVQFESGKKVSCKFQIHANFTLVESSDYEFVFRSAIDGMTQDNFEKAYRPLIDKINEIQDSITGRI